LCIKEIFQLSGSIEADQIGSASTESLIHSVVHNPSFQYSFVGPEALHDVIVNYES